MSDRITLDNCSVTKPRMEMDQIELMQTDFDGNPFPVRRPMTVDDLRRVLANLTPEQMEQLGAHIAEAKAINGELWVASRRIGPHLVVKL